MAQELMNTFTSAYIERFLKINNNHANVLAILASAVNLKMKRTINMEFLAKPIIKFEHNQVMCINLGPNWMDPIVTYLK